VPAFSKIDNRWRLLVPRGSVIVRVGDRTAVITQIRALPSGTPVAFVGCRGLRRLARRAKVRVSATYVALPSLSTPVAITKVAPESLRWTARSILAVPSGIARWHALLWVAVLLIRALPRLLACVPTSNRIMIGRRT
jgi:hypothetical protein